MNKTERIDSLLRWSVRVVGLVLLAIVALAVVVFLISFLIGFFGRL